MNRDQQIMMTLEKFADNQPEVENACRQLRELGPARLTRLRHGIRMMLIQNGNLAMALAFDWLAILADDNLTTRSLNKEIHHS